MSSELMANGLIECCYIISPLPSKVNKHASLSLLYIHIHLHLWISFPLLQKKGSGWCKRGSTLRLLVCLQKLLNMTQRTTGTAHYRFPHTVFNLTFCYIIIWHYNFLFKVSFVVENCRFFGNRSYCYYCLEQYPLALADAEKSIQMAPEWPKGYYRKGSALMGLKV